MKAIESQVKQIAKYLKSGKTLTPIDALVRFNCWNLKGRIFDIRQFMKVDTNMISVGRKRVAEYRAVL